MAFTGEMKNIPSFLLEIGHLQSLNTERIILKCIFRKYSMMF